MLEQRSADVFPMSMILNVCESKVIIKMQCFPDNVLNVLKMSFNIMGKIFNL